MTKHTFDALIDNIDVPIKEICLYLHGEPFLHKGLDYFAGRIASKNIKIVIFSNGYLIDLDLLDKLLRYKRVRFSFSLDIFSKEYYEQLRRPARYETMMDHLDKINALFRKHNRMYEISVTIENEDIREHHALCKKLFFLYDRLQVISFGSLFPWPDHFHTGKLAERLLKKRNLCNQIMKGIAVYWNGDVTICSFDYSGNLTIGNLTETKLSRVFNSPRARKIRADYYLRRYKQLPLCRQCVLPRFKSSSLSVNRKMFLDKLLENEEA
jgi:radical SAM protein with 4Fe4S-binding SPASM domain